MDVTQVLVSYKLPVVIVTFGELVGNSAPSHPHSSESLIKTMSQKHLPYLDGWRGMAIAFLLFGHFFPIPGLGLATAGVNLFFVLSGLLMARLLFVDQVPISTFYRRRISRIMPGMAVFVVLVVVAYALVDRPISWSEVATAITFTKNYHLASADATWMPFGHIWSLSVEEHSYIVLTLLAFWTRMRGTTGTVAVLGIAAVCCCFALYYDVKFVGRALNFAHTEVAAFGIFFSGGLFLVLRRVRLPTLPAVVYLALAALGMALHWWSMLAGMRSLLGVAVFAVLVNLLAAAPRPVLGMLENPLLRRLGLWSFSVYLWQQPFYYLAHRGEMSALPALALSLVAGVASYYLVECPARNYLNRHWGTKKAAPVAVTGQAA